MDDLDDLTAAQDSLEVLLAGLAPTDWAQATPCEDWDVAGVVRHLTVGERAFTVSLGGSTYDLAAIAAEVSGMEDLATAYADGATGLRAALATADDGPFPTGLGPMPRDAVARLRTIEALTHGWDVAVATSCHLAVDPDAAGRAIAHSLELIDRLPPGRTPFGPPQPVADDAPPLDRLVALLGRRVSPT